jgi:hypothetical protein
VAVVRVGPVEGSGLDQMWWGAYAIKYERHNSLSCRMGWVSFKYWASTGSSIANDGGNNAGGSTKLRCTVAVAVAVAHLCCTVVDWAAQKAQPYLSRWSMEGVQGECLDSMLPPARGRFGDSTAHRPSGLLHVSAHPSPSSKARQACRCARAALWLALACQRLRPDPLADQERHAGTVPSCNGDDRARKPLLQPC